MRLLFALLLLMPAVAFPLNLNGQTFTNSILGMLFVVAAFVLGVMPARDRKAARTKPWAGQIVAGLAVLYCSPWASFLPPIDSSAVSIAHATTSGR